MVDKSVFIKLGMQNVNIKDLTEASEVIKFLIKKYSASEIIKKTGVDKNVLYRLEHQQNVTLENWLKIKRCFPELFVPDNTEIGEIPIMGQLTGNKVLPLNPAQPKIFNAPKKAIEDWSPCVAYINNQPNAFTGTIRIFSTRGIDENKINKQCFNRLIIIFPEGELPCFGICRPNEKWTTWQLLDAYTGEKLHSGKINDEINWWRYTFTTSLYLMENETSHQYNQKNTEQWYHNIHKLTGN